MPSHHSETRACSVRSRRTDLAKATGNMAVRNGEEYVRTDYRKYVDWLC